MEKVDVGTQHSAVPNEVREAMREMAGMFTDVLTSNTREMALLSAAASTNNRLLARAVERINEVVPAIKTAANVQDGVVRRLADLEASIDRHRVEVAAQTRQGERTTQQIRTIGENFQAEAASAAQIQAKVGTVHEALIIALDRQAREAALLNTRLQLLLARL